MDGPRRNVGWERIARRDVMAVASRRVSVAGSLQDPDFSSVPAVSTELEPPGPPRIVWNAENCSIGRRPPSSVWTFLKLAEASDNEIASIAKRWGPLGICVCGKPVSHSDNCRLLEHIDKPWLSEREQLRHAGTTGIENWEPLEAWRCYSRQFSAILAIAYAVGHGRSVPIALVAAASGPRVSRGPQSVSLGTAFRPATAEDMSRLLVFDPAMQRHLAGRSVVQRRVSGLMHDAGILPELWWREDRPVPHLVLGLGDQIPEPPPARFAGNLFARLVLELVATVQRADGITRCHVCSEFIDSASGRALRKDGTHYCETCRPEAQRRSARERKAASRAKTKTESVESPPRFCSRPGCRNPLPTTHKRRRYCSDSCKVRAAQSRRTKDPERPAGTPTATPTRTNDGEPSRTGRM